MLSTAKPRFQQQIHAFNSKTTLLTAKPRIQQQNHAFNSKATLSTAIPQVYYAQADSQQRGLLSYYY